MQNMFMASFRHGSLVTAQTIDTNRIIVPDKSQVLDPLTTAEEARQKLSAILDPTRRSALGQFFTPPTTARLMASMSTLMRERVRLLDAGAGVGALTAAWTAEVCSRSVRPKEVVLTAYELDEALLPALRQTLVACEQVCSAVGISCKWEIRATDFIEAVVESLGGGLFQKRMLQVG
jgi:adenine-specific DNA-methyltransferase